MSYTYISSSGKTYSKWLTPGEVSDALRGDCAADGRRAVVLVWRALPAPHAPATHSRAAMRGELTERPRLTPTASASHPRAGGLDHLTRAQLKRTVQIVHVLEDETDIVHLPGRP